ncbi:MAG: septum formation initiator family protein [Candidatus Magasanikbacteria bacterium]|nr:septum formation initiator family protein [Candidatus Magasanikbacteria bacterium]
MTIPKPSRHFFRDTPWLALGAALVAVFLLVAYGRVWYRDRAMQQEIAKLQEEAARLRERRLQTSDWLRYVQSPAFIEAKARTDLNLARPGEQVTVIDRTNEAKSETIAPPPPALSNPQRWWRYFTHPD